MNAIDETQQQASVDGHVESSVGRVMGGEAVHDNCHATGKQ